MIMWQIIIWLCWIVIIEPFLLAFVGIIVLWCCVCYYCYWCYFEADIGGIVSSDDDCVIVVSYCWWLLLFNLFVLLDEVVINDVAWNGGVMMKAYGIIVIDCYWMVKY